MSVLELFRQECEGKLLRKVNSLSNWILTGRHSVENVSIYQFIMFSGID